MTKPKFGPSTQLTLGTFDTMKTPKAMYLMCIQWRHSSNKGAKWPMSNHRFNNKYSHRWSHTCGTYGAISTIDVVNEINYINELVDILRTCFLLDVHTIQINEYKFENRNFFAKFTINCIRIGTMSKSYICGNYKLQLWSCKTVNSIAT
jgi:hypothetical protein